MRAVAYGLRTRTVTNLWHAFRRLQLFVASMAAPATPGWRWIPPN